MFAKPFCVIRYLDEAFGGLRVNMYLIRKKGECK